MNILAELTRSLSKEELRFYKMYAARFGNVDERKDLSLLNLMRKKADDFDEEAFIKKHYTLTDKNAYYRLKNRLVQDISKSILLQHFETDDYNLLLHNLALSKLFFLKNNFKLSLYFLKKAERGALASESFDLLDIVYSDFIRLSYEMMEINPDEFIDKRKRNAQKLSEIRQIDDVLSVLSYRLKSTQNFSPDEHPVATLLEEILNRFATEMDGQQSTALRIRVFRSVSRILLQKHDYKRLEEYLIATFETFVAEKLFNKNTHEVKLQMLTYLVNALFKNGKMKQSLAYSEVLKTALEEHSRLLYDKYLFYYYNSQVINYSKLNLDKAIEILEQMKENEQLRTPFYEQFIFLNLAIFYFEKTNYKTSVRNFSRLYQLPIFEQADAVFRYRVSLAELLVRFEIGDMEFLQLRINQVKSAFGTLLQHPSLTAETNMIELLNMLCKGGNGKTSPQVQALVKWFRQNQSESANEEQLINFNDWLNLRFFD